MEITIQNFRGCRHAELVVDKISLVAGPNWHGKTSIAEAIACAATGNVSPHDELKKKDIGLLLYDGTKKATVGISNGENEIMLTYPDGKRIEKGTGLSASEMAVGMKSLIDMKPKERSKFLAETFAVSGITFDTFSDAIKDAEFSIGERKIHFETLQTQGYEYKHKKAIEHGSNLKGQWEQITGQKWGSKKGAEWFPDPENWDMDDATEQELLNLLDTHNKAHKAAVGYEAVSEAEIVRLRELAADEKNLKDKLKFHEQKCSDLDTEVYDLQAMYNGLKNIKEPLRCPHCEEAILIIDGKLQPFAESDTQIPTKKELADTDNQLQKAVDIYEKAKGEKAMIAAKYRESVEAGKELANIEGRDAAPDVDVEGATERKERAEKRLKMFRDKRSADEIHSQIIRNQVLIDALALDGLRQEMLTEMLSPLNAGLEKLRLLAGWEQLFVDSDMSIRYGGRPYFLCSESERFRVRVLLQLFFAVHNEDPLVIIDRADILDTAGRRGLVKLLLNTKIPALILMTMNEPKDVPNLSKFGGRSYWLHEGELSVIDGKKGDEKAV